MTIGQRIAECRKKLGLSQEALGEKLGVSRQAISKWEADGTLPEIDKLIGLSKLFGVTVGWLLGVEDRAVEADALTEEQLSAMELLIKTYASPVQPEKKESKKPLILSAAALVLAVVTLLTCLTHHNNLSNSLGSMSYQMMNLQSGYDTVRARINDLETGETEYTVPSELHGFTLHLTPDKSEPKVTVQLSAVPKQHKEGWQAAFSARKDGKEVASADCGFDSSAYTAELELPMADGYEYWLVLRNRTEGIQEQIPLQDSQAQNLETTFTLTCTIQREGTYVCFSGEDFLVNGLEFYLQRPISMEDGADYQWQSVEAVVYRNGEAVGRMSFISPEDRLELRQSVGYDHSGAFSIHDPPIRLEEGDGVEVWLIARLSNGMECKEMVGSWRYEGGQFLGGESVNQD